ncbi:type II secretion system secretin GspD [bacterium]|nr:type II secretion system secretin GspD [bacterium]
MNSYARITHWTARVYAPLFIVVQTFIASPAAFAATNAAALPLADASAQPAAPPATGTPSAAGPGSAAIQPLQPVAQLVGTNTVLITDGGASTTLYATAIGADASSTNPPLMYLQFEGVDIRTILLYLSDITGDRILPDRQLRGDVTLINPRPVTPDEAKQIIFSILEMEGFTIVRHPDLIKIVRSGDAKTRPIPTLQPPRDVSRMDTEDLIRAQVIYPQHILAKDVEKFLRPLLTKGAGEIIINEPTGAVIIIDTGANIKRLMEILEIIDQVIEGGEIDIRIVPLTYADETEMQSLLQSIFTAPIFQEPSVQKVTVGSAPGAAPAAPAPARSAAPASGQSSAELDIGKIAMKASFLAETRTHSLIVIAARRNFSLILRLISDLDMPTTEKEDMVHIYPLQHSKAEEITQTLNDIFSGQGATTTSGGTTSSIRSRYEQSRQATQYGSSRSYLGRSQAPTPTTQRGGTSSRVRGAVQAAAGGGLGNLAGKVSVLYDEPSNSLIIITARRYYESVRKLVEQLDRRTPQVWIEALIVDVIRDKNFNLGVGWKKIIDNDQIFGGNSSGRSLVQALDTTLGPAFNESTGMIPPANTRGISYAYGKFDKYGRFDPYFTLQTAEGVSDINVLSTPSVLASNNKEATISVGRQIPISRYSTGPDSTVNNYSWEYTDVNIELDVTPRINRHREVALEVKVTVREEGGKPDGSTDPTVPPIILDRNALTEVVVQDRQTLVIGGLIKDDLNYSVDKIPLLGDIPVLKHAFRTFTQTRTKQELLVFITPYVVTLEVEGDNLTSDMRDKYRGADSYVLSSERDALYDDVNRERRKITIYDDWREFEKHVEDAETYFRPPKGSYGTPPSQMKRTYYAPPETRPHVTPYEGELELDFNEDVMPSQPAPQKSAPTNTTQSAGAVMPSVLAREQYLMQNSEDL